MNFGLSKLMDTISKKSVKVVHDGTGLDEAFSGYDNHQALFLKISFARSILITKSTYQLMQVVGPLISTPPII